jgi:hypothetical protein
LLKQVEILFLTDRAYGVVELTLLRNQGLQVIFDGLGVNFPSIKLLTLLCDEKDELLSSADLFCIHQYFMQLLYLIAVAWTILKSLLLLPGSLIIFQYPDPSLKKGY